MKDKNRRSLGEELRNNFIFVSVISIAFVALIANVSINLFFSSYLRESRVRDDEKVLGYVETVYRDYKDLTPDAIMSIVHYAFSESVTVILKEDNGRVIWSSNSGDMMHCNDGRVVEESTLDFRSYEVDFGGNSQFLEPSGLENRREAENGSAEVHIGIIEIGRVKSIVSSIEDKKFLGAINLVFVLAIIFAVFLAIISSSRVSKRFLKPIYTIRENVNLIEKGRYKDLIPVETVSEEVHNMAESIEELSTRLHQQEALRRRMTTDMAHEVRTPLATLQSHIEAFMDGVWKADIEKLSIVHGEVVHLAKLIKELSDLAIVENDEIKINRSGINLSKTLKDLGEGFETVAANKGITLNYQIEDNIFMEGDPDHIKRIFINLLSNSYKYTNEGGKILILLKIKEDKVQVSIRDTGIGIPEKDLKLVFERFYRSDISRSRGTGGTGIGLTITKTLVEANGGSITIESEEGKGTRVNLEFRI